MNRVPGNEEAKRILAIALGRMASREAQSVSVGRVALSPQQLSEGIKARIIGKQGAIARQFETSSGCELLVNEQEDALWVSCFDPFRREVGRRAIERLVMDGRVNPAKLEEALASAKTETDAEVRRQGAAALKELGLGDAHPAVLRVLGTLHFRASYGQNQLSHSIETAWIAGLMAAEIGADVLQARRAGLLHDLGKALDPSHAGGHARAGADFAARYGESETVVQAIAAHHEDVAPETWLDHLVIAADALSGARPGARPGSSERLFERMGQMEAVARSFVGVSEAHAIQAGREVRVFVDSATLDDSQTRRLAGAIVERLQRDVEFAGEIAVTVLRELRVTERATQTGANPL